MEAELVSRAMAAATSLADALDLRVNDAVVIHNSNKLALRLLPSQFTSRDFRKHLSARGIIHRLGGYRDPESQAFIESWFGQFKKRCAWRAEWETIAHARTGIAEYISAYHKRPHSGLGYRTPQEVAATWRPEPEELQTVAT